MPPGRVLAVASGGSKRPLEVEETATRVTRSKVVNVTDHEERQLDMDQGSSPPMDDVLLPTDEASTVHKDLTPVRMERTPVAASVRRNQPLNSDVSPEHPEQTMDDDNEGKFLLTNACMRVNFLIASNACTFCNNVMTQLMFVCIIFRDT
jgi:hypothetical protein